MKTLDLFHRWAGGIVGLMLALLGLTGVILIHKEAWVRLPHASDVQLQDVPTIAAAINTIIAAPRPLPNSIVFASKDFGLHHVRFKAGAGQYVDQTGAMVDQWNSMWDRTEFWLVDLHHHLLIDEAGSAFTGFMSLFGLGFVISGAILWWRQRKTFKLRPWPARLTRPAIVRHHRDLGIVAAPLLTLSLLTGVMLTLRPVADFLISPWAEGKTIAQANGTPKIKGGPLAPDFDWTAMLTEARRRFPGTEFRALNFPRKPGDLISLRTKQPAEWLPNGRTTLWFDPADGHVVEARDALAFSTGQRLYNSAYPVHSAKVGGFAFKLVMSLSGLALMMLGSLAVWAFWLRRPAGQRETAPQQQHA